jgi:hypothetical protein
VAQVKGAERRTETLAQKIRRKSNNLDEQLDLMLAVSCGKTVYLDAEYDPGSGARVQNTGTPHTPDWSEVQDAIKWLADRGYGKATQVMAGNEDGGAVAFQLVSFVPRTMAQIEQVEAAREVVAAAESPRELTEHEPVDVDDTE